MNYFSDYMERACVDFEIGATERDIIIFKEHGELILMGMIPRLKLIEKSLREGLSKGEFAEFKMPDGWSSYISSSGSFHLFCFEHPILNLSRESFIYLLKLVSNHEKAYMITFEKEGEVCECEYCFCCYIYIWENLDLFEKCGLKIKSGDRITSEMLLKMLNIMEKVFRTVYSFTPKRLEELCMNQLTKQEKKDLPEGVRYSFLGRSICRDVPFLTFNTQTSALVYSLSSKGYEFKIDQGSEFWDIFSLFLKHKGSVLGKEWRL